MVTDSIKSKKALTLYKAYKMKNGETMKINPRQEIFFITEKSAVANLLESMVDTAKEDPLEDLKNMMGETVHILKVVIYTSRIPEEDWKTDVNQDGDSITLPIGKYQKTMNIAPVVIESFEYTPDKADPKEINVSKIVFAK